MQVCGGWLQGRPDRKSCSGGGCNSSPPTASGGQKSAPLRHDGSHRGYRQFARRRIDAVNHALAGIPAESVRYHLCWGSWHGPHTHDLPLEHIIDLVLEVKAQTYSFEAANVRHEHEWRVWQNAKLPPGKMLMPGVVSHATNLVEHPQLVADRILRPRGRRRTQSSCARG